MNFFRVCSLKSEKLLFILKVSILQHVKLARDRRKRKSRIKAAIFFAALLLILTGIFLAFKDTADYDPSLQSNLEPEMVDNVQYQSLTPEKQNLISLNLKQANIRKLSRMRIRKMQLLTMMIFKPKMMK